MTQDLSLCFESYHHLKLLCDINSVLSELQRLNVMFSMLSIKNELVILISSLENKSIPRTVIGHRCYPDCALCAMLLLLSGNVRKHHLIISFTKPQSQPRLWQHVSHWRPAKVKVKKCKLCFCPFQG